MANTEMTNQEPAAVTAADGTKTVTLKKTGRTATIAPFKGRHVREAQRRADGDSEAIVFHILCALVEIDGEPLHLEDIDDMDGSEVLQLMGEMGGNF
jgi:hypothetical protein